MPLSKSAFVKLGLLATAAILAIQMGCGQSLSGKGPTAIPASQTPRSATETPVPATATREALKTSSMTPTATLTPTEIPEVQVGAPVALDQAQKYVGLTTTESNVTSVDMVKVENFVQNNILPAAEKLGVTLENAPTFRYLGDMTSQDETGRNPYVAIDLSFNNVNKDLITIGQVEGTNLGLMTIPVKVEGADRVVSLSFMFDRTDSQSTDAIGNLLKSNSGQFLRVLVFWDANIDNSTPPTKNQYGQWVTDALHQAAGPQRMVSSNGTVFDHPDGTISRLLLVIQSGTKYYSLDSINTAANELQKYPLAVRAIGQ